ncbi:hypothetical protein QN095_02180 [Enterobacter cloacae]|uniref:fimbrial protein n=1 Tax=Enterobacter cloacae TaxID=550 RepID=UPI00253FFE7E|nr:hypothetical protein [Enterobacter cloacae]WIF62917.1 hypothetical protein QN095_02180 [Enterobacter cloacae]
MMQTLPAQSGIETTVHPTPIGGLVLPAMMLVAGIYLLGSTSMAALGQEGAGRGTATGSISLSLSEESVVSNHGLLRMFGALTGSPCRLALVSPVQAVEMGQSGTGGLQAAGKQGTPVEVQLKLHNYLRSLSHTRDESIERRARMASQPAVSVAIRGLHDPQLIRTHRVSGLCLKLSECTHHPLPLGQRGTPAPLTPGNGALTYWISPVRMPALLQARSYSTHVDFRWSYD